MSDAKKIPLTEEEAVRYLRNALLVAGEEMGPDGDHWPVIKDTVYKIVKDWEDLKQERAVEAEAKKYIYHDLAQMDALAEKTEDPEAKAKVQAILKELRENLDASFETPAENREAVDDHEMPPHLQRAAAIIATLAQDEE